MGFRENKILTPSSLVWNLETLGDTALKCEKMQLRHGGIII